MVVVASHKTEARGARRLITRLSVESPDDDPKSNEKTWGSGGNSLRNLPGQVLVTTTFAP